MGGGAIAGAAEPVRAPGWLAKLHHVIDEHFGDAGAAAGSGSGRASDAGGTASNRSSRLTDVTRAGVARQSHPHT